MAARPVQGATLVGVAALVAPAVAVGGLIALEHAGVRSFFWQMVAVLLSPLLTLGCARWLRRSAIAAILYSLATLPWTIFLGFITLLGLYGD
jgi:hypothetical protein